MDGERDGKMWVGTKSILRGVDFANLWVDGERVVWCIVWSSSEYNDNVGGW